MLQELLHNEHPDPELGKIALIGCRFSSAADVYSLLSGGFVSEIVLIGDDRARLLKEMDDLQRFVPPPHTAKITSGEIADAADAAIAVIAEGAFPDEGESRLHLLGRNASTVNTTVEELAAAGFTGVLVISTEPVDVVAQFAQVKSGYPAEKLIGLGTYPPDSDFEDLAGTIAPSPVTRWCSASAERSNFFDYCEPSCPKFSGIMRTRRIGGESATPAARLQAHSLATCITKICEAVITDRHEVLPVSTIAAGEYGLTGVYMTLPAVIGRNGVEKIVQFPLDEPNLEALHRSADLHRLAADQLSAYGSRPVPAQQSGGEQ